MMENHEGFIQQRVQMKTHIDTEALTQDTEVDLSNLDLTNEDFKPIIAILAENTGLVSLNVSGNRLTHHTAQLLAEHLPNLQSLQASNNRLVGSLKFLKNLASLHTLDLSKNQLNKSDIHELQGLDKLENLYLSHNHIRDVSVPDIVKISSLRQLNLSSNDITDEGAVAISNLPNLNQLDLSHNPIDRKGAQALKKCVNISVLNLIGTFSDPDYIPFESIKRLIPGSQSPLPRRKVKPGLFKKSVPQLTPSEEIFMLLSIDGGGIRGIIPAIILKYIEDKVVKKLVKLGLLGPDEPFYLSTVLDLVAGTSTGGLIALGLTAAKEKTRQHRIRLEELVQLYTEDGSEIFTRGFFRKIFQGIFESKYNADGIEDQLKHLLGDSQLKDNLTDVHIISYDARNDNIYSFKSHEARKDEKKNYYLRDVGRATSAAPTYFPAALLRNVMDNTTDLFIDGGVIANNPCYYAFEDAKLHYPSAKKYFVLSIGTGEGLTEIDYYKLKNSGKLGWASKIADLLMRTNEDNIINFMNYVSDMDPTIEYHRFQPELPNNLKEMDNVEPENVHGLVDVANKYIVDHVKEIKSVVDVLVMRYRMQRKEEQ